MASTTELRQRSALMQVLRVAPMPLLLVCVAGGVLMAIGASLDDHQPRRDSFVALTDASRAVRLDLPPDWRLDFRNKKKGVAPGLFTPEGEFAFEVDLDFSLVHDPASGRWRACETVPEFLRERERQGQRVEDWGNLGVARDSGSEVWLRRWGYNEPALLLTVYTPELCLRFVLRDVRFESAAISLFRNAAILPRGDPRADNLVLDPQARAWKAYLWEAGCWTLLAGVVLFIATPYTALYLQVVEASRGFPGLRPAERPTLTPELAAALEALQRPLSGLGFWHTCWFSLDDFDETRVGVWRHGESPAVAFVLYSPVNGTFRLRIVSRYRDGSILVSSTRLTDLAYAPPPGIYLQVWRTATVEELWAWHLDAEKLFPVGPPPGDAEGWDTEPRDLYVEVSGRWARSRRRDPTWLLAVEPFEECWRMYRLGGVSLRQQIARGWVKRVACHGQQD